MTSETAKRKIEMLDSYLQRVADYGESDHEAMKMAIKALEQEPKTGHWINIDATHSKCDRCLAEFEIASQNGEVNYCPNCGAKMVEP